ncbi:MAG TPA: TIR domain-containing protein [Thermoanaerobaculia bacterium]|nr:TIR domain-containing protein [Thermoanaerobaculia bacterium]
MDLDRYMTSERTYKAFISYSHSDDRWARWLQRKLEWYRLPRSLRGKTNKNGQRLGTKLGPVFRDREDLGAASSLSEAVQNALRRSEFLIVLCSTRSAQSPYVNEEVAYFKSLGRESNILAVILDGEPMAEDPKNECFPPALRSAVSAERETHPAVPPLAADLRRQGDGKRNSILKLLAGMLAVDLDLLRRRERQRRLQRSFVATTAGIALLVVLIFLFESIQQSRAEAARAQSRSLALQSLEASRSGDPRRGLRLALESLPRAMRGVTATPDTPEAGRALKVAVGKLNRARLAQQYGGHAGWIETARYLPSGKSFISLGSFDKAARLWDARSMNLLRLLRPMHGIEGLDVSPVRDEVAFATYRQTVLVWDAEADRTRATLPHDHDIRSVRFDRTGSKLLTITGDGRAILWNARSGQRLGTFEGKIEDVAFDPARPIIYLRASTGWVWRWDYKQNERKPLFHEPGVEWLAVVPRPLFLVTATDTGKAKLRNPDTGDVTRLLEGPPARMTALSIGPEQARLIAGFEDHTAVIWDILTGRRVARLTGHGEYVSRAILHSDGKTAITASGDGTARIWDLSTSTARHILRHPEGVSTLEASAHWKFLLTGDYANMLHIWNLQTGHEVWSSGFGGSILDFGFDSRGYPLVILGDETNAVVWSGAASGVRHVLPGGAGDVRMARVTPDGTRVLTSTEGDKAVRLWELATGRNPKAFLHEGSVSHLSISGNGLYLLTTADSGEISEDVYLWHLKTGELVARLPFETLVGFTSVNHDGSRIAVYVDGAVKVIRPDDQVVVGQFEPGLSLSPDIGQLNARGDLVVVGVTKDENAELEVWRVGESKPIHHLGISSYELTNASFSNDGQFLLTTSEEDFMKEHEPDVRVWRVASGHQVARAVETNDILEARFIAGRTDAFIAISSKHMSFWKFDWTDELPGLLRMAKAWEGRSHGQAAGSRNN